MSDKQEAHDLVDQLPAEQIPAAIFWLRIIVGSTADDEPVSEEDIRRYREAKAALARGETGTPMESFLSEFGLSTEDFTAKK